MVKKTIEEVTQETLENKAKIEKRKENLIHHEISYYFKRFQNQSGKYQDLDIDEVEFEDIKLSNKKYFIVTMGQSPSSKLLNENNEGIPFFQGKTNFGDMYLKAPSVWTIESKKEAQKDDLLISLRAPAGVVNIANINLSIGRGLASIRGKEDIYKLYLYYYMKREEQQIDIISNKSGFFTSIGKNDLMNLSIKIPKPTNNYTSYQIQEAIVEFLEFNKNKSNIFRGHNNVGKKYVEDMNDGILPALFNQNDQYTKDMFVKFNTNPENPRDPKDMVDFSLEDVEFEEKSFKDVFNIKSSSVKIKNKDMLDSGLYPVVSQSVGLINGYFNDNNGMINLDKPIIIFGDHTTILKYIDFDFLAGADGTKILEPKEDILSKYLYLNSLNRIEQSGYKRHFQDFKNLEFKIPKPITIGTKTYSSYDIQVAIVQFLDRFYDWRDDFREFLKYGDDLLDQIDEAFLYKTFQGNK
jgi:type I restriction enzyme S subunit